MNERFGNSVLRTEEEQKYDPYPDHLQIRCHNGLLNADGKTEFRFNIRDYGLACRILHRDERPGGYYYAVELEFVSDKEETTRIVRADVPRVSLAYFDVPGTTDINLPNAFRHTIGIPDEIWPDQWKNLLVGESDEEVENADKFDNEEGDDDDAEDESEDVDDNYAYDEYEEGEDGVFSSTDFVGVETDDDVVLYDDEVLFEELALEEEEDDD